MTTFYRVTGTHRGVPYVAYINHNGQLKTDVLETFEATRVPSPPNCFVPENLQHGMWESLEVAILVAAQLKKLFSLADCKVEPIQC